MEQLSEAWFEARIGKITGSRVGAILNLSPYASRQDVLRDMCREKLGLPAEFTGNYATRRGQALEPTARSLYERDFFTKVEETGLVVSDQYPFLAASPDGLIGETGLLEIKCPLGELPELDDTLSYAPHYYAQVQLQLYCTNRQWCDFMVYRDGEYRVQHIKKAHLFISEHIKELEAFMVDYYAALEDEEQVRKFSQPKICDKSADPTFTQIEAEYREVSDQIKSLTKRQEELKDDLIKLCDGRKTQGVYLTLTPYQRNTVQYKRIVETLLKDVDYNKYTTQTEGWLIRNG